MRRDHPYAAYDSVTLKVPVYQEGDVLRRMQVRVDEVRESMRVICAVSAEMRPGPVRIALPELPPDRCALGAVEGWRGEILHWIRTGRTQPPGALQDQGPVAQQLAGPGGGGGRATSCRTSR